MGGNTSKAHLTQRTRAARDTPQDPAVTSDPYIAPLSPCSNSAPFILSGVAMHRHQALALVTCECRRRRIHVPLQPPPRMLHPFVGVPIYQSLAISHKIRLQTMLGSGATARLAAALVAAGCGSGSSCHRTLCAIVLRVASRRVIALADTWFDEGRRMHAAGKLQPAAAWFECAVDSGHVEARAALAWMCVYGRFGVGMLLEGRWDV